MLSSVARIKTRLSITGVTYDALLMQLLKEADAWAKSYVRRELERDTYIEEYDGGHRDIILREFPVESITNVWCDADRVFGSDTLLVANTYYRLKKSGRNGILRKLSGSWPCGDEIIRVEYIAGYGEDEIPEDLREAVEIAVGYSYGTRQSAGTGTGQIKSERLSEYQVSFFSPSEQSSTATISVPKEISQAQKLLDPYKDWSMI